MKISNQFLIKYIFTGLTAIFFFVIIYAGYLRYKHEKQSVLKEKHQELYAISELKITHLVQWHKERLSEAGFFSVNNPYSYYAQEIIKGNQEAASLFRKSLAQIMTNKRYENVFMLSEKGKLLFSVDSGYGFADTITLFHTKEIFQTGKIIIRDFYFCNHHQKIHFDIIAPIINDDEKVIAALVFRVNPDDYLLPLIKQWPSPSETAETYIVGRRGDSIKYLHNLCHLNNSELSVGFSSNRTEITAVQAVMGYEGLLEGIDYRGEKVLADVRKVPGTPWYIISEVDLKEIFIDVNKKYFLILIITFFLILIVGAAIALIYNYRQRNIYRELYNKKLLLHQTQEELRATIYSIGDGVITTDHQGFIRHLNPVAENLTGWTVEESIGKKLEEVFRIINEETRKDEKSIVERVLREGKVIELSNRLSLLTKNGSEIPIADSAAPIKDEKGNILGVVMVFSDQSEQRRKQKQLAESEERFRLVMENSIDAILITVPDGTVLSANPAACKMFNMTEEEICSAGRDGLVDKTDPRLQKLLDKRKNQGGSKGELNFIRKDGTKFPAELSSSVFTNSKGELRTSMIIRDVTERTKTEEALRESERNYRELIDGMNETVWVIGFDGELIEVNNKALEILGYTKEELLTIGVYGIDSTLHKEEIEALIDFMPEDKLQIFETTHRTKDGRIFPVEIYSSIVNYKGEKAILSIARDISERKKVESELIERESILNQIFDLLPIGLWFADKEGRLTRGNPAGIRIWGAEPKVPMEEYGVFKARRLSSGEEIAANDWALEHTIKKGVTIKDELLEIDAFDGKKRIVLNYTAPVTNHKGEILGAIVVNNDITELKQAEEELKSNYYLLKIAGESAMFGGWSVDLESNRCTWSDVVAAIHEEPAGFSPLLKDAINYYTPEWQNKMSEAFNRCAKEGIPFNEEMEIISAKGNRKWVRSIGEAVYNETGRIIKVQGSFQDISKIKTAEIELRKSREYILTIINNLPIGLAVNTFTPEVKFEFMNENFARFYGVSAESLSEPGKFWDVVYEDPQYREKIKKRVEEDLKSNHPGRMEWTDIPIIHKGQPVRYISARDIPLPETDSVISTVWDVTERKLREEEVKKMNARLYHLNSILDLLVSAHTIEKVQEIITTQVRKLIGSDGCTFIVYEDDFCFYSHENAMSPLWKGMRIHVDKDIAGWVKANRQPVIIKDIFNDERVSVDDFKDTFVKSLLIVPINAPKPFGALGNYWSFEYTPTDDEIRLIQILCDAVAGVYENLKLKEDLEIRVKEKTHELQERISELERFREATINREIRMKELREEIKKLKGEIN